MPDQTTTQAADPKAGAAAQTQGQQTTTQTTDAKPLVFDEWIAGQDEPVKELISTRFTALENTVKATRDERDALKGQLKDLLKTAEKGSELEKSLTDAMSRLDAAEKKAAFLEEAIKPGIECRNPNCS